MTRPMITIHNSETDELIEREMNDQELAQNEQIIAEREQIVKEESDKKITREALLTKLGITAEEAGLLIG